jgi:hypothetical protein
MNGVVRKPIDPTQLGLAMAAALAPPAPDVREEMVA